MTTISNRRWTDEEFEAERKRTLAMWPTGARVDRDEAVDYHLNLPDHKNYAKVVRRAKAEGRTLVQPRGGVPLIDQHIELLRYLQDQGGADLLPTTTDTYTRNQKWEQAEKGIQASRESNRAMLNGLPAVNHGVDEVRRVIEAVDRPIMTLSGTPYPRLTSEITLAAGFTGYLGAGISYPASYIKSMSFEEGIRNYQYLDRLVSWYAERGVTIHREQPGFLTGTLIPPGVGVAIAILEMLLAAGQGVRHYSMGLTQNLDMIQDVAGIMAMENTCRHYIKQFGLDDMFVSMATHEWMQAFPPDESEAMAVISVGGVVAAMSGATQVITKTTHEAVGIPTMEANAAGVRATKKAIAVVRGRRMPVDDETRLEMDMIQKEAVSIVDKVLELGDGDPAVGAIRGFEAGVVDVPWAPNENCKGRIIPIRDANGAVRYLSTGDLPFPRDVLEFNQQRIEERAAKDGKPLDVELAMFDIQEICQAC